MYYSNGNYEAFARPKKPKDVDKKQAYFVGAGLASLAGAVFLIRDAQMPGNKIHIYEELKLDGGSLDGIFNPQRGFIMRGGREMENHFECLWDLFRSIPSIENKDVSVLDEFYWLNKEDPNFSKCRVIENRGQELPTDGKFTLTDKDNEELVKLFLMQEDELDNKKITDVFSDGFFNSNFWIYWSTMFAFEKWHSAIEMRRYLARFIHHVGGLPDFSALKFTKYNQYESLVLPLVNYLKAHGVQFHNDTKVLNVITENKDSKIIATKIILQLPDKSEKEVDLTEDDIVFVTNGSITESTTYGDNNTPAPKTKALGGSWNLWKNLAMQNKDFGHPEVFCDNIPDKAWFVSATITVNNPEIVKYVEKISKRDPYAGKVVTGGIVTVKDSNWMQSYTFNRQPQFRQQPKDDVIAWFYGLYSGVEGNFIKKPIEDCTGIEICAEWLYHLGVPEDKIMDLAKTCNTVPCYMPFITSYFQVRAKGDRPLVVPKNSVNLAFIGNFAETPRDTVFTTEYSVRTAMEAVYTLLEVDRGVPEVFASCYDVRMLMQATHYLLDGKKIEDVKVPFVLKLIEKSALKKSQGTVIEQLLEKYKLI